MKNYDPIALVDLDHTISNAFHRDAMIGTASWDEYHEAAWLDQPLHDMARIIRDLHSCGWTIIGLTARPSKWRKSTMEWLVKHDIPLDEILMRDDDDFRPAPDLKVALAMLRFGEELKDHVTVIFDDRDDVIQAFKALGVSALQVHGAK